MRREITNMQRVTARPTAAGCNRLTVAALVLSAIGSVASAGQPPGDRVPRANVLPGQIIVDPDHPQWLKRHGGGPLFICGPGDPEGFLYRGKRSADGSRDGDQRELIQKLIAHGGNCIYLQVVRSHGGDGTRDHNPFVDCDPSKGLDKDILDQWEEWFALMDEHNIVIYLFIYDDSTKIWETGDRVGTQEKAFVEGIVGRFKHHRNLIWIVGEESEEAYSGPRARAIAEVIRKADDHGHVIGNHHHSGTTLKTWQPGGPLTHFAMQYNESGDAAHTGAVEAWNKALGKYQVIYAENTSIGADATAMRRHAWASAMGGLMPMLLLMNIHDTPTTVLNQCRYLQTFFEATDFCTMAPHDELAHAGTQYVLADPGRSYIAYSGDCSGELGLKNLPAGSYHFTWIDCVTGSIVQRRSVPVAAGDQSWAKPSKLGREVAVWVRIAR